MITVESVSKTFRLYRSPADRLKEIVTRRVRHQRYDALKNISFTVPPGQSLGLVGQNGAGKSTLLKLLSGVLLPDGGHIAIDGRVTGLLELGTGFDSNLSGRRNILTNGLLLGMSADEVHGKEADIIEFAELGQFIDEPLRTYSSGMVMRLGFAIAIHASPRCFLVDEALSVGDGHFQQKCMRRIRQFRQEGGSIVFVSHDLNAIKQVCDRALVLDQGCIVYDGDTEGAVNQYNRIMARLDEADESIRTTQRREQAYGTREVEITRAQLCQSGQPAPATIISTGQTVSLEVTILAHQPIEELSLGFVIRDRFGQDIFGTNTHYLEQRIALIRGQHTTVTFEMPLHLAAGQYTITLAAHSEENHLQHCYHWIDNYLGFEVAGSTVPPFSGLVWLPTQVHCSYSE